jgi:multidrug efflux pump subunit AcrA (membrane-fusion protein)
MHNTQQAAAPVGKRRWWLPVLILAAAGVAAAGLIATKPKPQPVKVGERAWLVSAETPTRGRYVPNVTLFGRVESLWSSDLTAALSADVLEVPSIEGDAVSRGQLLVRLDDRDARLQLAQREAELTQAQARIDSEMRRHEADLEALPREAQLLALTRGEVSRLRDLVKKKVGAQSQLDTARQAAERQAIALTLRQQAVDEHTARLAELQAARVRAEALRDQALLELERCEVHAPFNGRIAQVLVSPGRRVRAGDPLISLYSTDAMIVRAQLPNRHLPAVRRAMAAGTTLQAGGEVDGIGISVRLRSLAADAADAAGGVDGLFDITDSGGLPVDQGRFVRLELAMPPADDLIALPHEAIYGADRVYVLDEQSRMRGLRVERAGEVLLDSGETRLLVRIPDLESGARVVTTQLPNALDGLLVRVVGGS